MSGNGRTHSPPRDGLVRALHPGYELRSDGDGMPTMAGNFVPFNEWAEINSVFEGHFLERFVPGSLTKTISEQRDKMLVLFQHGQDPNIGEKPLGPISELEETESGGRYAVPLLDTDYNRELLPGLEASLYGVSFRFKVMREEFKERPRKSDYNPEGLPERTVKEAMIREFGPVTFPAYEGATAGLRSMTDPYLLTLYRKVQDLESEERQETTSPETVEEKPPKEEETPDTDETAPAVATRTSWSLDVSHEEVNPWL